MAAWLGGALLALVSGCVGVVPIPPSSSEPVSGQVLRSSDGSFIVPGVTTRREVEQRLGKCTHECPRAGAVAYTWEKPGWEVGWWAAWMYGGTGGTAPMPMSGWKALLIAYDKTGRVEAKEIVPLNHRHPLDNQMVRWAESARRGRR